MSGGKAAVEMDVGAVLRAGFSGKGAFPRSHEGRIDRDEQFAASAGREVVRELDADRAVLLGDDDRAQIMEYTYRGVVRIGLPITPEKGRLEFGVQLFRVLAVLDLIIVAAREGACIGNAHGDVLTESVRIGRVETGDLSMNLWSPPVKGPTSDAVTSAPAPVGSVIKTRGA